MGIKNFVANQFKKPTGLFGKIAVRKMMKGNLAAIKWTIENCEIKKEDTVLEIGFGHGISLGMIAELTNQKIYGLDFSEDMVKNASERNRELVENDKVELKHGSIDAAPYVDNYFDKIIAVNVIYFWNNPENELKEILRILKPGGRAVLFLTDKETMEKIPFATRDVFNIYTGDEFLSIVKRCGFNKVRYETKRFTKKIEYICHCVIAEK